MTEHAPHRDRRLRRDRALAPRRDRARRRADHGRRRGRPGRRARAADRRTAPGRARTRRSTPRSPPAVSTRRSSPFPITCTSRSRCAALAAGLHVLLEKPLAPTLDACDRILDTARAAGTVFMVAENAQYWPEVRTVRDAARATARSATSSPPRGDVLPRARRLLRRRTSVALRPGRGGRRRRDRHRFALAAAAARVARRGRRGRRRARPSRSAHGGRVVVPRPAPFRVGHHRVVRRDAHDGRRSRPSRCSRSPAPPASSRSRARAG